VVPSFEHHITTPILVESEIETIEFEYQNRVQKAVNSLNEAYEVSNNEIRDRIERADYDSCNGTIKPYLLGENIMRRLVSLWLLLLLVILFTYMSTQPLVKPVQAKMLPNWVEYSGKSKMEDKNCRKTNLKCYNLPLFDCVKAADHPTVCQYMPLPPNGIRMWEQLPIGFLWCTRPNWRSNGRMC
jgi:hypothetical protein